MSTVDFKDGFKEAIDMANRLNLAGMQAGREIGHIEALTQVKVLVNALLDIRESVPSGSYEMGTVDKALEKLGIEPWKPGFKRYTVNTCLEANARKAAQEAKAGAD